MLQFEFSNQEFCLYLCLHVCMIYIHAHIHTYKHTYIHTYIHVARKDSAERWKNIFFFRAGGYNTHCFHQTALWLSQTLYISRLVQLTSVQFVSRQSLHTIKDLLRSTFEIHINSRWTRKSRTKRQ